jgi:PAS domain S-box-containing protein
MNAQSELPGVPRGDHEGGSDSSADIGAVFAIIVMLGLVLMLTLYTSARPELMPLHLLYRRLFYVPIVYAAYEFGRRGGVLTALAVSVPFGIHAVVSLGGLWGKGIDNGIELVTYFALGLLFGSLRDTQEESTRDLTDVKVQLEEAYRKLEERAIQLINVQEYTQSILRSITSGVLTVGPDGSIATANPAAERILGLSEYEMVPRPLSAVFADDAGISEDVSKVLQGRLPLTLREATVTSSSQKVVHVQASTSRMRAVGGKVLGAVVTIEDVSEIKALTEQLIRADRLAAMGELTAGVAHEVRNPLGVIKASVQLLEDAQCEPARIREAGDVIKQEIDRLDKVVKALLDFGRPSKPTLVRLSVHDVIQDVVLFTQRFATRAEVKIETRFAEDIGEVMGDPDQLKQVFLNLVTNAVQAMDPRGGTIVITTKRVGDFVDVTVADDGPGIAAEDLGKVFDPFFTKRSDGTGLGLTIVHRIIDDHDGHIEVESSRAGTAFTVALPLLDEELEE